jgi:hypothetical protein
MKPLTLTTRKVDGKLEVEGCVLALKTFSKPEKIDKNSKSLSIKQLARRWREWATRGV